MTAANLVVRERAAYLLTDSATYRPDGTIIDLKPKVIASPELRVAIATAGVVWGTMDAVIRRWLGMRRSSDEAASAIPMLIAMLRADRDADYRRRGVSMDEKAWPPQGVFRLVAATWSAERRRPEGYTACSRGWLPQGPTERFIQPPEDGGLDVYGADFDPERDGLALLEAQRGFVDAYAGHIVGGTAYLTTVSECGVTTTVLREWPDEIGRRIEPNRQQRACA
jgi:hypothetical protein